LQASNQRTIVEECNLELIKKGDKIKIGVGDVMFYRPPGVIKYKGELVTIVELGIYNGDEDEWHNVRWENGEVTPILACQLEFVRKGDIIDLKEVAVRARKICLDEGSQFTEEELEFMRAIDSYKKLHRRPFPSLTEVLAIAKSLGYRKS
jgi:hypothetical protein